MARNAIQRGFPPSAKERAWLRRRMSDTGGRCLARLKSRWQLRCLTWQQARRMGKEEVAQRQLAAWKVADAELRARLTETEYQDFVEKKVASRGKVW